MVPVRRLDADGFLRVAGAFLSAREAEHNLLLGLAGRLIDEPTLYGDDAYFAVVERDGALVAAAVRTPPYNLVLSETSDPGSYAELAADARNAFGSLPGVIGPADNIGRFVAAWTGQTGHRPRQVRRERIYEAAAAIQPRAVSGRPRRTTAADRDLLVNWFGAFIAEANSDGTPDDVEHLVDRRISDPEGALVFWEDHVPVSFAGYGSPTPNGIRIGPVYTPPERRGCGYASALVAHITAELLTGGRAFCFLFADLANATSNSIYQQVGYRPVTDVEQWAFDQG